MYGALDADIMEVKTNLPSGLTKYDNYQRSSLSQKVSFNIAIIRKLVGSDQELSDIIAILTYIYDPEKMKLFEKKPIDWILGFLDVLRLSHFYNSEKTDILTKLGSLLPKEDDEEDWGEDES